MLTAIEEISAPVPVCLWPWLENPNRLVSLLDMYKIAAEDLVKAGRRLQDMKINAPALLSPHETVSPDEKRRLITSLEAFHSCCESLRLPTTLDLAEHMVKKCKYEPQTFGEVGQLSDLLTVAFEKELARNNFYYVDPEKAKYIRPISDLLQDPPIGTEGRDAFPSCIRDIGLAGECYGTGFNDACVFHLMRVLEKGLGALANVFAVPFKYDSWNRVIEAIEREVRKINSSLGPDWKEKQQFYAEAAREFIFFKDAWRNHVMHGRDVYDAARAKNIYEHVCMFMKLLAVGGLSE